MYQNMLDRTKKKTHMHNLEGFNLQAAADLAVASLFFLFFVCFFSEINECGGNLSLTGYVQASPKRVNMTFNY